MAPGIDGACDECSAMRWEAQTAANVPADRYLSGAIAALHAKDPQAKLAFVYSDDPFSKAVMLAAREQARAAELEVVLDESYAPSTTDFSPIINNAIAAKADALKGGGHYADGATIARQLYDQKAGLKWLTLLVAPGSDEFATLGPAALGVTVPSQWEIQATYKPQFGPTASEFAKAFEEKFKVAADYHSASAMREARFCSVRSRPPARSASTRSRPRSTRAMSRPSSATSAAKIESGGAGAAPSHPLDLRGLFLQLVGEHRPLDRGQDLVEVFLRDHDDGHEDLLLRRLAVEMIEHRLRRTPPP